MLVKHWIKLFQVGKLLHYTTERLELEVKEIRTHPKNRENEDLKNSENGKMKNNQQTFFQQPFVIPLKNHVFDSFCNLDV